MKKFLKNLVPGQNLFKIVPCVTFFKKCSRNFDMSTNMALANGGYLHCPKIETIVNSSLKASKEIGYGHLKNSGERSRAILALLFIVLECNTNF